VSHKIHQWRKKFKSGEKKISIKYKKMLLNKCHDLHCSKVAKQDFDPVGDAVKWGNQQFFFFYHSS
jgi:hypothetical protein